MLVVVEVVQMTIELLATETEQVVLVVVETEEVQEHLRMHKMELLILVVVEEEELTILMSLEVLVVQVS